MHDASATEGVRRLVSHAFAQLGADQPGADQPGAAEQGEIRETILIRDGYYCGRRFETDTASAVWFVEENQVKVFRSDGTMVRVLAPEIVVPSGRAAA